MVRRRVRRRHGRADVCRRGRPGARELRCRRRTIRAVGAGRAGVGRAGRRPRRPGGGAGMTAEIVDEVPVDPARARVYAEGWQSWSPATWYRAAATALRPDEDWQHTMRF